MSRFPFLLPKKLMKATGRYLSPPILISSATTSRPLTYILIANNLNQNKILRLHNHARSFMTCIFLTNGTIHFNPLNLFQFYQKPQTTINYHFCCLNCSSDITMAGGISYPTVPRLHDASPPSILPILALTSSAPALPTQIHPYSTATSPLDY
ncbi:hypothetical protein PAPYR_12902 [Paratrimastix pyriformis]|uniref:Uncharacterized protein n=1 Tax=Paratrimastix pyriformis TaxID=342808 RepID=A0ABQ8U6B3_9EUKA|nr:hypothetical protein PAPYR_12902 [Paratrimastix pyriformis]